MKKNIKLIIHFALVLVLSVTLVISICCAWYIRVENLSFDDITASTPSKVIGVIKQGVYSVEIGENPFPSENDGEKITGVLSGDTIYYSFSIGLSDETVKGNIYDLNINIYDIDGGEYFSKPAIKVVENPNGISTGESYEYNGKIYEVFEDSKGKDYFIYTDNIGEEYLCYLYISASGQTVSRKPQKLVSIPNGTLSGNTIIYEDNRYETYYDEIGGEYFITNDVSIVDGVQHLKATYINYIFEQNVEGESVRYNMCDVYTVGVYKVFGVDENGEYEVLIDNSLTPQMKSFEKENGTDKKIYSLNVYDFENWDTSLYGEIVFTLAIKFDYSLLEEYINVNCVSNKEFIFSNIVIRELEKQEAIE